MTQEQRLKNLLSMINLPVPEITEIMIRENCFGGYQHDTCPVANYLRKNGIADPWVSHTSVAYGELYRTRHRLPTRVELFIMCFDSNHIRILRR